MPLSDRAPAGLLKAALAALAALALVSLSPVAAHAAPDQRPAARASASPGSLTGYAFDTCTAPSQPVMDAWWQSSPYSAVGVYIGGSNRLCDQPELTPGWVASQLQRGWHLLPLYVGPQAGCSSYPDRMALDRPTAEAQGAGQADAALAAAQGLGLGTGTTLYYDLEDYDTGQTDCRQAALSFVSGWTQRLHASGYQSGVYSNIAAAIGSLDLADRASAGSYVMPDDIWFAWANGRADTVTDERVLSHEWDDHDRVHQYAIDVSESHGGYALSIDSNWVDVGQGSVAPKAKALCKGVDADLRRYPTLGPGKRGPAVAAAQCLLRRLHVTKAPITGRYDARTAAAVRKAQRKLHLRQSNRVTRATWAPLLARGSTPVLKVGSTGDTVLRLQRSLTAALGRPTRIDGVFTTGTARAVAKYQRKHGLEATGVVTTAVWESLRGR